MYDADFIAISSAALAKPAEGSGKTRPRISKAANRWEVVRPREMRNGETVSVYTTVFPIANERLRYDL